MMTSKLARVQRLQVWTPQGHAGLLSKDGQHVFNYAPEVLAERDVHLARAISLSMPVRPASYHSTAMLPVFQTFLPEGFLAERIAERFGKTLRIDDMALLALSGANSIGRLQVSTTGSPPPASGGPESLGELLADQGSRDLFEYLCDRYLIASGISGIQPKVMLAADDKSAAASSILPRSIGERATLRTRNVIVKVGGDDFPGLAENEFHCMSIARRAGLSPPLFWLSDDGKRFVIERFDIDNTTGYAVVCTTAYIEKDMPALSLGRARSWPSRDTLAQFGGSVCRVARAEDLIDTIIDAACSYRPASRGTAIWPLMKKQIAAASFQLRQSSTARRTMKRAVRT